MKNIIFNERTYSVNNQEELEDFTRLKESYVEYEGTDFQKVIEEVMIKRYTKIGDIQ